MTELTVLNQQSLLDLSLQVYGTAEGVVTLAFANGLSLTDEPQSGDVLLIPEYEGALPNVVDFYDAYAVRPATALREADYAIIANEDPCNLCKCFL